VKINLNAIKGSIDDVELPEGINIGRNSPRPIEVLG